MSLVSIEKICHKGLRVALKIIHNVLTSKRFCELWIPANVALFKIFSKNYLCFVTVDISFGPAQGNNKVPPDKKIFCLVKNVIILFCSTSCLVFHSCDQTYLARYKILIYYWATKSNKLKNRSAEILTEF